MSIPSGLGSATTNATNGLGSSTFFYVVTALDGAGGETAASAEISVALDGLGKNASNVSWSSVTGAVSYRVYNASSSGGQESYFEVTDTNFTHSNQAVSAEVTAPTVTTAYVVKISSKGDSWLVGGNVGIGTTSPNDALEIVGNVRISGSLNASRINVTDSLVVNNTLFVNDSRVGIGTTSPGDILHLSKANGAGDVALIIQNDATTNEESASVIFRTTTSTADFASVRAERVDSTNARLKLRTTQGGTLTTVLTADNNGNVGIGTTAPNDALEVIGNVRISGSLNASLINSTILRVNNTLFVNDSRVGIGTAAPATPLEAHLGVTTAVPTYESGTVAAFVFNENTANEAHVAIIGGSFTGRSMLDFGDENDPDIGQIQYLHGTNDMYFTTDNSIKMSILDTGEVGIGTTLPATTLDVQGKLNVTGNTSIAYDTLFVDNTSGRVGIKGTKPGFALDVVGSIQVREQLIILNADGTRNSRLDNTGASSNSNIEFLVGEGTAPTTKMILTEAGNVGIGSTIPNATLFVQGNTTIVGNLNVTGTAYIGTLNVSGVTFTGGNIEVKNITIDNFIKTPSDTLLNISPGGNLSVKGVLDVDTTNNRVGIGTSSPLGDLHVDGTNLYFGTESSSSNPVFRLRRVGTTRGGFNAAGNQMNLFGGATSKSHLVIDTSGNVGINDSTPSDTLTVNGTMNIRPLGTSALFVQTDGNVGIGTTNPAKTLTVEGELNVSGLVTFNGDEATTGDLRVAAVRGGFTNLFYVDVNGGSGSGAVGIGTATPFLNFATASGDFTDHYGLHIDSATLTGTIAVEGDTGGKLVLGDGGGATNDKIIELEADGGVATFRSLNDDLTTNTDNILVMDLGTGNVGIGNTIPNATLDVSGNIYLSAANPMINLSGPTIRKSGDDIVISD